MQRPDRRRRLHAAEHRGMPLWRNKSMSSIESVPAIIPATSNITFAPGGGTRPVPEAQVSTGKRAHRNAVSQRGHRNQPGIRHEIRLAEPCGQPSADMR
jgi:hypothetical protein